jgi:hypothetical protein
VGGFEDRHLLVDHLREDLLVDAELPDQLLVDAPAELLLIGLDLRLVARLEVARVRSWPSTSAITSRGAAPSVVVVFWPRKSGM